MKNTLILSIIILHSLKCVAQDTLIMYLDDNFIRTEKTNAKIVRQVIVTDNHYYLTDKNINGGMIVYCEYKSYDPWIEDGFARYYYEPDVLYSTGKYENGVMVGQWLYFLAENLIDTINYLYPSDYDQLTECTGTELERVKKKIKNKSQFIIDSLSKYLTENFHLPARARSATRGFRLYIKCQIDTLGRIICLDIPSFVHEDINLEIKRILLPYISPVKLDQTIGMQLEFDYSEPAINDDVYFVVEDMPRFKYKNSPETGLSGFKRYISDNIKIPSPGCSGRVFVQFVVDQEGKIDDIQIVRGIEGCDGYIEEINRVFNSCLPWIPGKQNGKQVRVQFTLPIVFGITINN